MQVVMTMSGLSAKQISWIGLFAGAAVFSSQASASDALARKHGCVACHDAVRKLTGPSWKDISSRYRDGAKSSGQLAASIKAGGSGKWGPIPMPRQAHVSDSELKALATWILARK
ncbi:MAG: c-type cytochrome [Burkholderiales bacterium]